MKIRYTDNCLGIDGYAIRIEEGLKYAIFDPKTGNELFRGSDHSCSPTQEQMTQWSQEAKRLACKWQGRLQDLEKRLYIRFGNLPKGGRSRNHLNGTLEAGTSVYPAKYDLEGCIVFDDDYGVWQQGTLINVMHRTPFLVDGNYAGKDGSDGEPLLRDVRKNASLAYEPGKGFHIKRRCASKKAER